MLALIKAELVKIWKLKSTKVYMLLIFVVLLASAFLSKQSGIAADSWRQETQKQMEEAQQGYNEAQEEYKDDKEMRDLFCEIYEEEISLYTYSLEHDIPYQVNTNWSFLYSSKGVGTFTLILLIMIAVSSVLNEYTYGTMKQMLICPFKRGTILLANQIGLSLYALLGFFMQFIFAFLIGTIFFSNGKGVMLEYKDGAIIEIPMLQSVAGSYFMNGIFAIILMGIAVGFAIFFKNALLSFVCTFLVGMGDTIFQSFLGAKKWYEYTIFPNLKTSIFFADGNFCSPDQEMIRAIFVIVGYLVVFIGAYYFYFTKTDVKNGR